MIQDLWLACSTQAEIADEQDCDRTIVSDVAKNFVEKVPGNQNHKAASDHATDFEAPIYNIWKQQTKTKGPGHFGNSEVRWLDNLLYLYTKPFDVVVDPFAGGGSTIDVCRKRFPSNLLCGLTMWLIATVRPCRTCRLSWWREMAS
jgi:hypothetical protein